MRRQFDAACRQYEMKTVRGKNLLDLSSVQETSVTANGGTLLFRTDGGISGRGAPTGYVGSNPIPVELPEEPFVFWAIGEWRNISLTLYLYDADRTQLAAFSVAQQDWTQEIDLADYPTYSYATLIAKRKENNIEISGIIYPQIEIGNSRTSYERYGLHGFAEWHDGLKSGFPSVKLLGKTEQQSYTGKNLAPVNDFTVFEQGVPAGLKGVQFPAGTYTISARAITGTALHASYMLTLFVRGVSGSAVPVYGYELLGGKAVSFSEPWVIENVYATATAATNPGNSATFTDFQIEGGSVATAYEPYVGGVPSPNPDYLQEVKANNATVRSCGKNLFDMGRLNFNSVSQTGSDPGYVSEIGTDYFVISPDLIWYEKNQEYDFVFGAKTSVPLKTIAPQMVAGRRYTLRFDTESFLKYMYLSDGSLADDERSWYAGESREITEEQLNTCVTFYGHAKSDGLVDCRISNIQIEEGETVTNYEPYFDGGEVTAPMLYGIGEYRDEWDPQTGRGIRRIAKVALNGSEAYAVQDNLVNTLHYSVNPEGIINTPSQNNVFVLCSHLTVEANTLDQEHCMGRNNSFHFFIDKNRLQGTTIAAWMKAQYDAGTPVTIWYVLDEPVPFQTDPQRLTCPTGYGQIIQMAGDIPDAPLEVKYLAHGGNVK